MKEDSGGYILHDVPEASVEDIEEATGKKYNRANPSCRHCYGTGIAGQLMDGIDTKDTVGKILKRAQRTPITCSCVKRANKEKVPWLQRYGIDNQPWLKEEEEETNDKVLPEM